MALKLSVNRESRVPLYCQVAEQLEDAILDGRLSEGEKLSNEVTLAHELGLSRPTMRQAIQLLVDKGLLVRKRREGTRVVRGKVHRPIALTSLYDDLHLSGARQRTDVLVLERGAASPEVAEELRLKKGAEEVWYVERLRYVDEQPLAYMKNYLPCALIDLDGTDLAANGLYLTLRQKGIAMRVARQRISARSADPAEARMLKQKTGAPLLSMERTAYDAGGRAVEYGRHAYRADRYTFESTLVDR